MSNKSEVEFPGALITEEMVAEVRKYIGIKLRTENCVSNREATGTAIQKFADGIGDTNPLWTDPEYAVKTRYGAIVAPPSWVFSVFTAVQYGFRRLGGFHSSSDVQFYLPVLKDDLITPEMTCIDIEGPKKTSMLEEIIHYLMQRESLTPRSHVLHTFLLECLAR